MSILSSRERLLYSFENGTVDKVPVSPFIHGNFVKEFYKDSSVDLIEKTIEVYENFGFDIMHRNINVRFDELQLESEEWKTEQTVEKHENTMIITTVITTPEKKLRQVVQYEDLSEYQQVKATKEWFIKDEQDFEQFLKYQPPVPKLQLDDLKRAKKLMGNKGITAPWISSVFNTIADYRKLDDVIVDALLSPEFYKGMCEYFLKRSIDHVSLVLEEGVDVLSYAGNIAGGKFVGPEYFEKYILVYEKKLIDYIQSRGTHVLYHNCGDARSMIDVYNKLEISAFESMTEPPYADNDLSDAVNRFNSNITLIGNIDQISFLRESTPKEIEIKVKEKLDITGKRKGFILGTSDFLEENTPAENLFALIKAARRYGLIAEG